jgi:hypothetical protein
MYRVEPIARPDATSIVANGSSRPASRADRQPPDLRVEGDLGEARDVVERQRLEADEATLERDRLERLRQVAHVGIVRVWSAPPLVAG